MKHIFDILRPIHLILLLLVTDVVTNVSADNLNLPSLQKDMSERSLNNPSYVVGQYWFRRLNSSQQLINYPPAYDYLKDRLDELLVYTNLQNKHIEIGILNNSISNAFVIPGNHLFLYSDIIRLLDSEEKLIALLAHEVAHLDAKHYERQQQNSLQEQQKVLALIGASIALALTGSDIEAGSALWLGGIANHSENTLFYSRSQEQEADRIGKRYLQKAGIDDSAMNKLFQSFSKASPRGEQSEFLSTHPVPQNRASDALTTTPPTSILLKNESESFHYFRATLLVYRSLLDKQKHSSLLTNSNTKVKNYMVALHSWLAGSTPIPKEMIENLDENNPFESYLKTQLYIKNNEYNNALTLIQTKLSLNPENINYLTLLAQITHSKNNLAFDTALDTVLDTDTHQYQKSQIRDSLIEYYKHTQNLPLSLAYIAQQKFDRGKTKEATAHLQRAKQLANTEELNIINKIMENIAIIQKAQIDAGIPTEQ